MRVVTFSSSKLYRFLPFAVMGLALAAASASVFAQGGAGGPGLNDNYDRLDGTGESRKKVNVIEWEGNLEVHVYPGGSLAGLGAKLDKATGGQDAKVMVLAFRFDTDPQKTLVRRAILGVPFREGFKVYRDRSSGSEYDKLIITNNTLAAPMVAFNVDPEPTQLYPDGHPALAKKDEGPKSRKPAASGKNNAAEGAPAAAPHTVDEDGGIKPFFMNQ